MKTKKVNMPGPLSYRMVDVTLYKANRGSTVKFTRASRVMNYKKGN